MGSSEYSARAMRTEATMADEVTMKWWGWGDPARESHLPQAALDGLRAVLGAEARTSEHVALEAVELPDPQLSGKLVERLASAVGSPDRVRQDRVTRVAHAAGKGYVDLIRVRAGRLRDAPDAVLYPETTAEVAAVLALCADAGIAVVPFGGGTSVVGGVEPVRGSFDGLISLDLGRMKIVEVDSRSLTAKLGPGLRGPRVEEELSRSGVTLGHFPQSWEFASVGGWVATRSAGQASTGFGKIEEMVAGLECVSPSGEIDVKPFPASAAGPQLRELLVGSEGTLGVITETTLKVHPFPRERRYEGWMFKGFAEGGDAFRQLEQGGAAPDIARLSDEAETALTLQLAGRSLPQRAGGAYVKARGFEGGCLAILGFEGNSTAVRRRRAQAAGIMRSAGALSLGSRPGRAWARTRYDGPYLRDALLDNCMLVETLETAGQWSGLMDLYVAVREDIRSALVARGTPPLVMCHISHLYPNGASLYFTFIAAQEEGAEFEQWRAAKSAAMDAIVAANGTITHHHAVGRDHAPWLSREIGNLGVDLLRAMKARLDPAGIMNPGKLVTRDDG
jgi:alkyldihydroxyacetonephosphate synthase